MSVAVETVNTACGIVSRSKKQTAWTVQCARYRIGNHEPVRHLTDDDIVWLLVRGWTP